MGIAVGCSACLQTTEWPGERPSPQTASWPPSPAPCRPPNASRQRRDYAGRSPRSTASFPVSSAVSAGRTSGSARPQPLRSANCAARPAWSRWPAGAERWRRFSSADAGFGRVACGDQARIFWPSSPPRWGAGGPGQKTASDAAAPRSRSFALWALDKCQARV